MGKAEDTRRSILQKAFELTYANGYQATSIDDILATTQVTKGAFYYHFRSKDEMGLAIINEILKPGMMSSFRKILQETPEPLDAIYNLISSLLLTNQLLKPEYGCPVANLTQEMTPWNTSFSKVLHELTGELTDLIKGVLEQGKAAGTVRPDVTSGQVTLFILSGYWGIRSLGKLGDSKSIYTGYLKALKGYLQSLQ